MRLVFGPQNDGLVVGAVDLDALGLDIRIVLKGVVDDAAVVGVHRLELDDVAPAANLLGGLLGLLGQLVLFVEAVAGDVDLHLLGVLVTLKEQAVEDVLQVKQCLALAADKPPGIVGCLQVEHLAAVLLLFLDGDVEAEVLQDGVEQRLGVLCGSGHGFDFFFCLDLFLGCLAKGESEIFAGASTTMFFVSLVCKMLSMFCTVQ